MERSLAGIVPPEWARAEWTRKPLGAFGRRPPPFVALLASVVYVVSVACASLGWSPPPACGRRLQQRRARSRARWIPPTVDRAAGGAAWCAPCSRAWSIQAPRAPSRPLPGSREESWEISARRTLVYTFYLRELRAAGPTARPIDLGRLPLLLRAAARPRAPQRSYAYLLWYVKRCARAFTTEAAARSGSPAKRSFGSVGITAPDDAHTLVDRARGADTVLPRASWGSTPPCAPSTGSSIERGEAQRWPEQRGETRVAAAREHRHQRPFSCRSERRDQRPYAARRRTPDYWDADRDRDRAPSTSWRSNRARPMLNMST